MSGADQLSPAEAYAAAKSRAKHAVTQEFIDSFDFGFDDFQIEACHALEDGHGVLVAAPTGEIGRASCRERV